MNILSFRSCYIDGELVSVGDDVVVDLENDKKAVGQIEKLFHHSTEEEPNRAKVHWYFEHDELDKRLLSEIGQVQPRKNELFWPVNTEGSVVSRSLEVINAETIQGKCTVACVTSYAASKMESDDIEYFVRFAFNAEKKVVPSIHRKFPKVAKQMLEKKKKTVVEKVDTRSRKSPRVAKQTLHEKNKKTVVKKVDTRSRKLPKVAKQADEKNNKTFVEKVDTRNKKVAKQHVPEKNKKTVLEKVDSRRKTVTNQGIVLYN